jgi:hypothetical protein|tara:strand:+ start:825 stop:1010 length:186 start_codon:yes stop_codon:yes gene_type:complete
MNKIIISFVLIVVVLISYEIGRTQGIEQRSEEIHNKANQLFDDWLHQESPYTKTEIKNLIS